MAQHSVTAQLQVLELTKAGSAIECKVYADGTQLGTIEIGAGSFGWRPAGKKRFKRKSWTDFEKFMEDNWS